MRDVTEMLNVEICIVAGVVNQGVSNTNVNVFN
jgi:hypothetical protein